MKKRIVIGLLTVAMALSSVACGSSAGSSDNSKTETNASDTDADKAASDTSSADDSDQDNGYDLTAAETEQLVSLVKEKITTQYLDVYNIDPATFSIPAYVPVTLFDSTPDNIWANVQAVLQQGVVNVMFPTYIAAAVTAQDDELALEHIKEDLSPGGELELKATFAEQAPSVYEAISESAPEQAALIGAIYEGLAEFLNSVDLDRRAEIYYARGVAVYEAGTDENGANLETLFDQVIEENISFE